MASRFAKIQLPGQLRVTVVNVSPGANRPLVNESFPVLSKTTADQPLAIARP